MDKQELQRIMGAMQHVLSELELASLSNLEWFAAEAARSRLEIKVKDGVLVEGERARRRAPMAPCHDQGVGGDWRARRRGMLARVDQGASDGCGRCLPGYGLLLASRHACCVVGPSGQASWLVGPQGL